MKLFLVSFYLALEKAATVHPSLHPQSNFVSTYIIVTCIIIKCEQTSLIETKGSSSEYTA